jgi:hypothetical protein
MPHQLTVAPINSLLFLSDVDGGKPPIPVWGAKILSTPSCISFACYPEQDGPTQITIGNREEVAWTAPPAFEGELETPHRAVIISTVDMQTLVKTAVTNARTHVAIWYDHPRWPERIAIGLN